ncbi:N-acetyltransferase [Pseudomonas frederiksbergensis]|uniref:N-acetyltransferase domain-containing protein n=1 Tax=Pseudomonas frederiksbergensis TaxID=104087 RepID=A0A423I213_9PSED|nr:N-acetyltransferase [Pseudomonas frederiksbergensis]RON19452.1 hypothetical protein BK662_02430 [Pseudomonas frederiksbergensis]
MEWFDPMKDFFARRQWMRRVLSDRLPEVRLRLTRTEQASKSFLDPSPTFHMSIESHTGLEVGSLRYGVNPLNDRLYVFWVEILDEYRRHGYGLAVLWALYQQYRLPIVPNHIRGSAIGFWAKARNVFRSAGVTILEDLRVSEMDDEKARWAHLIPEPEHLRLIRECEASPEWTARHQQVS